MIIDQIERAASAFAALRRELADLASILESDAGPEALVLSSEEFMAEIADALGVLLSTVGDTDLLDQDMIRNLVFGGDTICVSFYGAMGPGCLYLQPDGERPLVLEDLGCDRDLSRLWAQIESCAAQPALARG